MADRFTIELDGEGALQRRLGDAVRGLQQPHELMETLGALMERNINFRFDTKTDPAGNQWLPLAASTKAAYEKKYKGKVPGSLLERTRHMRESLSSDPGDVSVEVGFGVPYAIYHETGTRRGLPRRQLLTDDWVTGTLGAQDQADIKAEIEAYLAGLF